jgi:hypothetical protein
MGGAQIYLKQRPGTPARTRSTTPSVKRCWRAEWVPNASLLKPVLANVRNRHDLRTLWPGMRGL